MVTRGTIPAGALSVVNFAPKWGDKQANKTNMLATMAQAHANGVKMIVFPEMALTGYVSSSDPESPAYRMAVSQAETAYGKLLSTPCPRDQGRRAPTVEWNRSSR